MNKLTIKEKAGIGLTFLLDSAEPRSPYGRNALKNLRPYSPEEYDLLETELYNVQAAVSTLLTHAEKYDKLLLLMGQLRDIEKTVRGFSANVLSDVELFEIKRFLIQLELIADNFNELSGFYRGIDILPIPEAMKLLDPDGAKTAGFSVSSSCSPALREVRRNKRLLDEELRKTPDAEKERRRLALQVEEEKLEFEIRKDISRGLADFESDFLRAVSGIERLDMALAKAALAQRFGGIKPVMGGEKIMFRGMTNPMVEQRLNGENRAFTPISIELEGGATVITGANMGGKSVAIKTLILNVYLAHCGFFVFAQEAAIRLLNDIHIVCEDYEDISRGLSSYGGEIIRLNQVTDALKTRGNALVALDEFASGTNPHEGALIAAATVKYFNRQSAVSVFATHYDGVAKYANAHYQVTGLREFEERGKKVSLSDIQEHMNYGLIKVRVMEDCPKDAISISRLLNMEPEILEEISKLAVEARE